MHGGFTESYGLLTEYLPGNMKKGDATNFGIETPSKRKKTASSVPSARPSTSTSLNTVKVLIIAPPKNNYNCQPALRLEWEKLKVPSGASISMCSPPRRCMGDFQASFTSTCSCSI